MRLVALPGLARPASTSVQRVGGSRRAATDHRLAARPSAASDGQHGDGPSTSGRRPAPKHSHGYNHHHAPAPLGALPNGGHAGMRSLHGVHSPVLRSLALSTVAIPRRQLQERYGGPGSEAGGHEGSGARGAPPHALAAQAQAPTLLPGLLRIRGALDRRGASAAAEEETPLSTEALTLVLLSTAVAFICSIDRAAMSVAILPMSEQFAWDDAAKGAVSSAFFAGYMITNLCGGFLATKYSAKGVLALGVVLWSMFTIATPSAAAGNLSELMLARAAMGVGEGVTYPSIQNLARRWVPEEKRSRALAFIYSGHQLGTIGSYLLCPMLIARLGWESVFWIFGSLGFVWLLGWLPLVSDNPPAAGGSTPAAALAGAGSSSGGAAAAVAAAPASGAKEAEAKPHELQLQDVPWASFARSKAFWAIVAAQCTVSVGNVLAFSWLPTFYHQVYGVDVAGSSAYSVLPFVVTVAATNAAGWIADGLVNNKVLDKTRTRKLMQAIASLGPAICLVKLAADQGQGSVGSLNDAVALVTAWVSLCGFSAAGYGSNHQDISKQYSGILYGLSNGLASVAASVSIYATGQVLHYTHDWSLVFEVAAGLYAVGALAYLSWASCEEQFALEAEQQPAASRSSQASPLPASPRGKLKAP